ncbi:MAG: hypothetical protein UW09_C0004G0005 [candidate division TM6 bacterium GW2011_GWF2_43_87]|nr:MAG: hypothetical protein UW09_C0004G0005 [candidate division TM6 bacterium GW2011_GWF2_43_87]
MFSESSLPYDMDLLDLKNVDDIVKQIQKEGILWKS